MHTFFHFCSVLNVKVVAFDRLHLFMFLNSKVLFGVVLNRIFVYVVLHLNMFHNKYNF